MMVKKSVEGNNVHMYVTVVRMLKEENSFS